MQKSESNFSTTVLLILLLGAIFIYSPAGKISPNTNPIKFTGLEINNQNKKLAQVLGINQPAPVTENDNSITKTLSIEARSALAEDFLTGEILFEKNKSDVRPLASLTKIISSLVVLDKIGLDEEVEFTKEHFLARDLISMAMIESSNDAVAALAEYAAQKNGIVNEHNNDWFLDLMRRKALSFGVDNMIFLNNTGLDISESSPGAYGSAESLLKTVKKSLDSPLWQLAAKREITSKEGTIHVLKPTNLLLGELPNLIGSKTGLTDLAGGNLLIIVEYPFPGGHPIGIVVLGSSEEGRFDDVKKILEFVENKNP